VSLFILPPPLPGCPLFSRMLPIRVGLFPFFPLVQPQFKNAELLPRLLFFPFELLIPPPEGQNLNRLPLVVSPPSPLFWNPLRLKRSPDRPGPFSSSPLLERPFVSLSSRQWPVRDPAPFPSPKCLKTRGVRGCRGFFLFFLRHRMGVFCSAIHAGMGSSSPLFFLTLERWWAGVYPLPFLPLSEKHASPAVSVQPLFSFFPGNGSTEVRFLFFPRQL